ncbi:MAG: mechanosensitive ion channel [Leptolyngbya sp. SIO4C1]|nr:mechanosensitive ion channel [Leptolyngbya sp. SIO4C1]
MDVIIQEIQETAVNLVGQGVSFLPGVVMAVIVLALTRFVAGLVRRVIRKVATKTLTSLSLQSLLVQTSYVTAWIVGILFACILAFPGLRLGDIVALLGLGSVAIGFAFQDIFKNFLAGILLLLQEPFSIGDQIIVEGFEGTVESIALRSTQIRTYQGEEVFIPNSVVFTSPVQVMTARPYRRTDLTIGVDYNTPLPMARETLLSAVRQIDQVRSDPAPEIDIVEFADSSINLVVRYWTKPEIKHVRRTKTQVIMALKRACDSADISIPYPIRSVYFFDQDRYDDYQTKDAAGAANGQA